MEAKLAAGTHRIKKTSTVERLNPGDNDPGAVLEVPLLERQRTRLMVESAILRYKIDGTHISTEERDYLLVSAGMSRRLRCKLWSITQPTPAYRSDWS